ncbi:dihydropteroate synthase [Hydrogenophaga sp.]|uniref:dihydropteroate synthase n=1 Tax=Hydrogenophaga sp. TaxID=1904254 RepID=UPI0025C133A8|nr:dihydropteroate synthase [Hydrogenophaga sp.]MBT9466835.1 dihydropteroate synthase [Hydrogenophaga sp.]
MHWQTTRFDIDLATPQVMGIVNVTPDSFSDGGQHAGTSAALKHCEQLIQDGAHMLDIGGESTRPGSPAVPLEDELARVLPVVREAVKLGVPVSVDTYKPEVMRAVLDAGADIVNDIWALRRGDAMDVVAAHPRCGVCLMHMHRDPQTMQVAPMDGDVLPAVSAFLRERASALMARGVAHERIVLDAGVGFGKTVAQNFSLLAHQSELMALGWPMLAGWSRKSSLGAATGREVPSERIAASVAAALLAVERGARVVRVHDVRQTVDALRVWQAIQPV